MVLAPGALGQLGILPGHTYLITRLDSGELVVRKGGQDRAFAISGGFMEVQPDRVIVLADTAEAADEIDVQRAEAARERATRLMQQKLARQEFAQAEAALRRSLVRLQVVRRHAPRSRMMGHRAPGEE